MSLSVHEIVARGTPLEWFESVAIAQELGATAIRIAGHGAPRVPDAADALVRPDGSIELTDTGPANQSPVFRLGHVLNALLSNAAPPLQLRLLVLSALAPEPTYRSLPELTRALEFYERPGRRETVRAVYERARRLPETPVAVPPVPEQASGAAVPPAPPKKVRRRREHVLVAVALPIAFGALAAGWWWSSRPQGARVLKATTQTVSKAFASAVATVRDSLSTRPAVVPETAGPPAPTSPSAPPANSPLPQPIRPARSLAHGGLAPIVVFAPPVRGTAPTIPPDRFDEVIYLNLGPPTPRSEFEFVYSAADKDVRPPVALHPKLPSEPPPGVRREELTQIEVLISAEGDVESVRIVAGPRAFSDGMMLSAVKAWKFQPATRGGLPVAYRQLIWLTNPTTR